LRKKQKQKLLQKLQEVIDVSKHILILKAKWNQILLFQLVHLIKQVLLLLLVLFIQKTTTAKSSYHGLGTSYL
jgi:hypothetical protein